MIKKSISKNTKQKYSYNSWTLLEKRKYIFFCKNKFNGFNEKKIEFMQFNFFGEIIT